jgi:hypothetical protein
VEITNKPPPISIFFFFFFFFFEIDKKKKRKHDEDDNDFNNNNSKDGNRIYQPTMIFLFLRLGEEENMMKMIMISINKDR